MKPDVLSSLCCPDCGSGLRMGPPVAGVRDSTGSVVCPCGSVFPLVRGVPRFVASDDYARSFTFQWTLHARTQFDERSADESSRQFEAMTGWKLEEFRGLRVLDAGVGPGRFADPVLRAGGSVLGVDLSGAAEVAHRQLGSRAGALFIQADLMRLPLRPGQFDRVYCLGVLHHTPDPRGAFLGLVRMLRPGGEIAIFVYPRYGWYYRASDLYRKLTVHLPPQLLYALAWVSVPLFYVHRIPGLGAITSHLLPTSQHPRLPWRVLDTFDWYSPRYQSKHTYPEVFHWFQEAGLEIVDFPDYAVCVRGRLPG